MSGGAVLVPLGVSRAALRQARDARSPSVGARVGRAVASAWAAWQRRRAERQAWLAFLALDDATLRDLGLDRSDLASFAHGAGTADTTRRRVESAWR